MTIAPARSSILPDRVTTPTLRTFLRSVPSVDEVGVRERVAALSTRSIKRDSKRAALGLIVEMIDLTTLEGKDTAGKVAQMCAKAIRPDPIDRDVPSVAAVCVYPSMVKYAVQATQGTGVRVASVATYFPSGLTDTDLKVEEASRVVRQGADEVDMVIDRGAFLAGEYFKVFDEIRRVKDACGDVHLKVILETGELVTLDNVRRASMLAMAAGADFIKTSTGKIQPAATLPVTLVMLEAIRDFMDATEVKVGMKPAGGIRTSKDAIKYLVVLNETLGEGWMTPEWFRFGASSLLNDVLMQIRWLETGRYQSADYFTKD
ncbi:MAG: deoxyribose-phosphate aldolase [Acidimicrobiia bacterium]